MKQYLAIDIGASSGRHIVGWREDGEIKTKEVYRFPNGVLEQAGHLVWDADALWWWRWYIPWLSRRRASTGGIRES